MAKKTDKFSADQYGKTVDPVQKKQFHFGKNNFRLMAIGLGLILLGFILMMGADANTTPDGKLDPNYWNEDIFSFRRIRIAPFLVISGFVIQIVAILKRNKN